MNVVLIGMMGSGKSTVGRLASKKLGWAFHDSDKLIEKEENLTVAQIFETRGEAHFRHKEKEAILKLTSGDCTVIATGGGAPCFEENWSAFKKNSRVVWLKASPGNLLQRLKTAPPGTRPLLKPEALSLEKVTDLLTQREPFYSKADLILETDRLDSEEAAEKIAEFMKTSKGNS